MSPQPDNSQYLIEDPRFQQIPEAMRTWILHSPNAMDDFADFFRKGGTIEPAKNIGLPYYVPLDPPKIFVDKEYWYFANLPTSERAQFHMFGTLIHEIGHDRYNTGVTLFAGGSAEAYVRYRSEIEAHGIFNAFPIFKDLENHPHFKNAFPYDSIGYLQAGDLKPLYDSWRSGKIDDAAVVARIADKVPDANYDLPAPLADQNGDAKVTHRDLYLRDYQELIRRQPEMAAPNKSAQTSELDSLDSLIAALGSRDESTLRAMRETYFRSPDGQQLAKEAVDYSRTRQQESRIYLESRGLAMGLDGQSIGSLTGRRDPRDWDHPDHALYSTIRRDLPSEFTDETAAQVMLQAKQNRILHPHDIDSIEVHNGKAFIAGKHFQTAHVDLSQDPPPMQDTVQQSQLFDQQLAQERAQWLSQQQELARSGPSMSL